jgi:hypothetical protein
MQTTVPVQAGSSISIISLDLLPQLGGLDHYFWQ